MTHQINENDSTFFFLKSLKDRMEKDTSIIENLKEKIQELLDDDYDEHIKESLISIKTSLDELSKPI